MHRLRTVSWIWPFLLLPYHPFLLIAFAYDFCRTVVNVVFCESATSVQAAPAEGESENEPITVC